MLIVKNVESVSNPQLLKEEVKQLPGVSNATLSSFLPTSTKRWPNFVSTATTDVNVDFWPVDEDYIATLGMTLIACLGLFGLSIYAAEQRNREIAIRKVLGAKVTGLVSMLSRDFLKLVLLSILIATPLAWLVLQKWLQSFAYRDKIQWWVVVTSALGALLIAFLTVGYQSVKAALTNPVESLRAG